MEDDFEKESLQLKYAKAYVLLFLHFIEYYHPETKEKQPKIWNAFCISTMMLFGDLIVDVMLGKRKKIDFTVNQDTCEADTYARNYIKLEFYNSERGLICRFRTTRLDSLILFINAVRIVRSGSVEDLKVMFASHGFGDYGYQIPALLKMVTLAKTKDGVEFSNLPKAEEFYQKIAEIALKR